MAPTIVLVTGANTGIGYETVKALVQSDKTYRIILGCRSLEKAQQAIETLRAEFPQSPNAAELVKVHIDLASDESIQSAFKHLQASQGHIDILINNGGGALDTEYTRGNVSLRDSFTKAYDINVSGNQVLTHTLMPLLLKSADPRLLFVTGLSGITVAAEEYFPTPPQPAGWPKSVEFETIAYRCTKLAVNMLVLDWNHKLKEDGVKVWGVGPGFLATGLGNAGEDTLKEMGARHPSVGGQFLRRVAEGERDADVGKLVQEDGIMPF